MKDRKSDHASSVSSNKSINSRAMWVRTPEESANLAPQTHEQIEIPSTSIEQPETTAPPTTSSQELQNPTTSATWEALQQIHLVNDPERAPNITDSTKTSHLESPPIHAHPIGCIPSGKDAGDIESFQPSIIPLIVDTAAQVEPIPNPCPSPIIVTVSPTDPGNRSEYHNPNNNFELDDENTNLD